MFWLLALRTIQRIQTWMRCGILPSLFLFSGNIDQVYSRPEVFPKEKKIKFDLDPST